MRLATALLFSFAVACSSSRAAVPPSAPHPLLGRAVSMSLVTNDGQQVDLPPRRTKALLEFWAPSCAPCRPRLERIAAERAKLRRAGTEVVLVAVLSDDESTDLAERTLSDWGVLVERFAIDRGGVSAREAGVTDLPAAQLYDTRSVLRWVAAPESSVTDLEQAAAALE